MDINYYDEHQEEFEAVSSSVYASSVICKP